MYTLYLLVEENINYLITVLRQKRQQFSYNYNIIFTKLQTNFKN